jgi:hypothetical protein
VRAGVLAFALGISQGCYTYRPLTGQAPPDAVLVLTLNDRGRAELGELVGPAATHVEGRLRAEDDTSYMVNVMAIRYVNGQNAAWAGEALTVRKTHVAVAAERELSRSRTLLVVGGAAAAVGAFVATRGFGGRGGNPIEGPPGEPPDEN